MMGWSVEIETDTETIYDRIICGLEFITPSASVLFFNAAFVTACHIYGTLKTQQREKKLHIKIFVSLRWLLRRVLFFGLVFALAK